MEKLYRRCTNLITTWNQDQTIEKGGYTIEVISVRNWAGEFCLWLRDYQTIGV